MNETVQCLTCSNFSLQDVGAEWLRQGFGNCAFREKFIMFGARRNRICATHEKAAADIIEKRDAWLRERDL